MDKTESVNSSLDEERGAIDELIKDCRRRLRNFKLIIAAISILLVGTLIIPVSMYNLKQVPIEFTELSGDSKTGDDCCVDSLVFATEAFEVTEKTTYVYRGTEIVFHPTNTYYLALDDDGFSFLICTNSSTSDYLESLIKSDDKRIYGKVIDFPDDIDLFLPDPLKIEDFEEFNHQQEKEDFYSTYTQFKVLDLKENYRYKTVKDGLNVFYILVFIARVIVAEALIAVIIIMNVRKKKYNAEIYTKIENFNKKIAALMKEAIENIPVVSCKKCGSSVPADNVFCHECGAEMKKEDI